MKKNLNYGKIEDGSITYAPYTLTGEDGRVTISPTAEMYAAAGWMPVVHDAPNSPDGKRVKATRYEVSEGRIVPVYEYEDAASGPVLVSKAKVEAAVDRMGKTAAFITWINSRAVYVGAWTRGGDEIAYDPSDNGSDLISLIAALGVAEAEVPALIAEVTA